MVNSSCRYWHDLKDLWRYDYSLRSKIHVSGQVSRAYLSSLNALLFLPGYWLQKFHLIQQDPPGLGRLQLCCCCREPGCRREASGGQVVQRVGSHPSFWEVAQTHCGYCSPWSPAHEWAQGVGRERKESHELARQLLRDWKHFVQIEDTHLQKNTGKQA